MALRYVICSIYLFLASWLPAQEPSAHTEHAVRTAVATIMQAAALVPDVEVQEDRSIPTAVAYIKDRRRWIGYNPDFMARLRDSTRTDWAPVSVLAHEIAHHLLGHTLAPADLLPGDELACDRWSGHVLRALGAPLDSALAALVMVGKPHGTHRHPPRHDRLEAVRAGWSLVDAPVQGGIWPGAPEYRYQLRFDGDPRVYYVDAQDRMIRYGTDATPVEVGLLEPSERAGERYLVHWQGHVYFVDARYVLWRRSTHGMPLKVGRMTPFARP